MRQRLTIWVGDGEGGHADVHTEDDMIMIEDYNECGDEVDVLICPEVFPKLLEVLQRVVERDGQYEVPGTPQQPTVPPTPSTEGM